MNGFTTVTPFEGTSTGDLILAIRSIINALLALVAVIAVIAIIFGTAAAAASSDDEAAQRARNNIIFALVGLIIVALSAVLVNFIINAIY